jgi:hypothetical protein
MLALILLCLEGKANNLGFRLSPSSSLGAGCGHRRNKILSKDCKKVNHAIPGDKSSRMWVKCGAVAERKTMKKFLAAFGIVFVLSALLNFVIHGVLLKPLYQQSARLMRGEADAGVHAMFLMVGFFFFSLGFVWIYARGVESKPWVGQGIRYAIAVWLIAAVSRYAIYYAIQPWPAQVV